MTLKQRQVLSTFILLNLVVYGVLGILTLVILPEQDRGHEQASAAEQVVFIAAFEPSPTNTAIPSVQASLTPIPATASPAETSLPTPALPTNTPLPWQNGGSWYATPVPSQTLPTDVLTSPVTPLAVASPTATSGPTPLPWQEGGSWWVALNPPTPTLTLHATPLIPSAPAVTAATPTANKRLAEASQPNSSAVQLIAQAAPKGVSPSNASMADDSWRTLSPGDSIWYIVGKGGDHIDAFLDATPLLGMTMQVYAPGNLDRPIGQGSFEKGRLVWAGGKWNSTGDWLARVTNGSPSPVTYRLTTSNRLIGTCNSHSYWEYIGQSLVYWTACH